MFLEVHLAPSTALATPEEVFKVLTTFCATYARAVDEATGWTWKMGAYNPEISIMIRVDGLDNEWLTVKLGVDRRHRRDIRPGDKVLLIQVFHYEVEGELQYGDDPQPICEQYRYTK
jgi:hypothetical protein